MTYLRIKIDELLKELGIRSPASRKIVRIETTQKEIKPQLLLIQGGKDEKTK